MRERNRTEKNTGKGLGGDYHNTVIRDDIGYPAPASAAQKARRRGNLQKKKRVLTPTKTWHMPPARAIYHNLICSCMHHAHAHHIKPKKKERKRKKKLVGF